MLSAAWPLAASAQTPPKIPRVGYIAGTSSAAGGHIVGALRQGLRELGYVEGQTIALEVRWAEGRNERILLSGIGVSIRGGDERSRVGPALRQLGHRGLWYCLPREGATYLGAAGC